MRLWTEVTVSTREGFDSNRSRWWSEYQYQFLGPRCFLKASPSACVWDYNSLSPTRGNAYRTDSRRLLEISCWTLHEIASTVRAQWLWSHFRTKIFPVMNHSPINPGWYLTQVTTSVSRFYATDANAIGFLKGNREFSNKYGLMGSLAPKFAEVFRERIKAYVLLLTDKLGHRTELSYSQSALPSGSAHWRASGKKSLITPRLDEGCHL